MKDKTSSNVKLGAMVIASLLFLVFSLYMIGKNQNIFGSSFEIFAQIDNVNGLVPGNNVRFQGLDVGTVRSMAMQDESRIVIKMLINKSMQSFIKKNALVSINTDGLMGNKIVQIHPQPGDAASIEVGDTLFPIKKVGTDEILEKLSASGDYLELTLINLSEITEKLNNSEAIWKILSDAELTLDLKASVKELLTAGQHASAMAKAGREMIVEFGQSDGIVNKLFTDSLMSQNLEQSVSQLQKISADAADVMVSMKNLIQNIEKGEGAAGLILADTSFRGQLVQTMENVEQSTYRLNQNMEALKSNFLFRKFYRDQEKAKKKAENEAQIK
ncbi:MAG: MCE family protein [Cyclobacterium sp.]|nr:MCE family protein [Cyclobacterium sp.]